MLKSRHNVTHGQDVGTKNDQLLPHSDRILFDYVVESTPGVFPALLLIATNDTNFSRSFQLFCLHCHQWSFVALNNDWFVQYFSIKQSVTHAVAGSNATRARGAVQVNAYCIAEQTTG